MNEKFYKLIFLAFLLCLGVANTPPVSPIVYFKADSGKVILNWDGAASMASLDEITGYYDFEGFRIYKSEDGGLNWGDADGRVYYGGQFVGWMPYAQYDLNEGNDTTFCFSSISSISLNPTSIVSKFAGSDKYGIITIVAAVVDWSNESNLFSNSLRISPLPPVAH